MKILITFFSKLLLFIVFQPALTEIPGFSLLMIDKPKVAETFYNQTLEKLGFVSEVHKVTAEYKECIKAVEESNRSNSTFFYYLTIYSGSSHSYYGKEDDCNKLSTYSFHKVTFAILNEFNIKTHSENTISGICILSSCFPSYSDIYHNKPLYSKEVNVHFTKLSDNPISEVQNFLSLIYVLILIPIGYMILIIIINLFVIFRYGSLDYDVHHYEIEHKRKQKDNLMYFIGEDDFNSKNSDKILDTSSLKSEQISIDVSKLQDNNTKQKEPEIEVYMHKHHKNYNENSHSNFNESDRKSVV